MARIITDNLIGGLELAQLNSYQDVIAGPYHRVTSGDNGFFKPDEVVRNPLVQGYRKPSSYSCGAQATLPNKVRIPLQYQPHGSSRFRRYEGSAVFRVPATALANANMPNENNVRMKLLNNVRSEVLDVAMVLAEISGTANTLSTGLLRVARSMDAVKRRKPENFFYLLTGRRRDNRRPTDKFLRESAGTFLEWKYGIMPTVYDIQGACKGLDMSQDGSLWDNPPLLVGRAVDVNTTSVDQNASISGFPGSSISMLGRYRVRCEHKARIDYRVDGEILRGLNRYGLGLGSVATVLFDKTPFSFVLNMAVPIAELIKAWTALAGVTVVGYCETLYREVELDEVLSVSDYGNRSAVIDFDGPGEDRPVWRDWKRVAYSLPPMPLPYVRNPVKVGNMQTILALFTQMRNPS